MGRSSARPCAVTWHTSGDSSYAGRARPTATALTDRPPSTTKPAAMGGGWALDDALSWSATVGGDPRRWWACSGETTRVQWSTKGGWVLVTVHCSGDWSRETWWWSGHVWPSRMAMLRHRHQRVTTPSTNVVAIITRAPNRGSQTELGIASNWTLGPYLPLTDYGGAHGPRWAKHQIASR